MATYYAVHKGRQPGIYSSWGECKKQVDKFVDPIFKKFSSKDEAQLFLKNGFGENQKLIVKQDMVFIFLQKILKYLHLY